MDDLGPYELLPLTQGYFAKVSPEDFPSVSRHKWYASVRGTTVYAHRDLPTSEGGGCVAIHREIVGALPGTHVDHRNGDGLDNRRGNLLEGTVAANMMNREAGHGRYSRHLGVTFDKRAGRWKAQMGRKHLGRYDTEEAANHARLRAERQEWGIQPRRVQAFMEAGLD